MNFAFDRGDVTIYQRGGGAVSLVQLHVRNEDSDSSLVIKAYSGTIAMRQGPLLAFQAT